MSIFTTTRNDLAAALAPATTGIVHTSVPTNLDPPCLVLEPADPWVSDGDTFGSIAVAMHVYVLVEVNENDVAADDLDTAIEAVLTNLPDSWALTGASQPQHFEAGEWVAHGTRLTVETIL